MKLKLGSGWKTVVGRLKLQPLLASRRWLYGLRPYCTLHLGCRGLRFGCIGMIPRAKDCIHVELTNSYRMQRTAEPGHVGGRCAQRSLNAINIMNHEHHES